MRPAKLLLLAATAALLSLRRADSNARVIRRVGAWWGWEIGTRVDIDRFFAGELAMDTYLARQAKRDRELNERLIS